MINGAALLFLYEVGTCTLNDLTTPLDVIWKVVDAPPSCTPAGNAAPQPELALLLPETGTGYFWVLTRNALFAEDFVIKLENELLK